jgi:bifunctional non-homologous end joining protein LigD
VNGPYFYEKRCPAHRPSWVKTEPIWSESNRENIQFCVCNDLATLVWAANLADLELHTSLSHARTIDRPTMMVFDLDPGPPATLLECCDVALHLRELFDHLELEAFPKTSGSKGLQIYIPLNTPTSYDQTKPFAHAVARLLEQQLPKLVVSQMKKSLRTGKVLIDWSQNDPVKTTSCVYSLRARERPTVSTPVTWAEVDQAARARDGSALVFEATDVLARVERHGDLFAPVLTRKQRLPRAAALVPGGSRQRA